MPNVRLYGRLLILSVLAVCSTVACASAAGTAVRAEAERLLKEGAYAGAAVVATGIEPVFVGNQGVSPEAGPVTAATRFDLASCSKPIVATVCAVLAAEGRLDVDAPFTQYLPEHCLAATNHGIRVRDLALHTSGFRALPKQRYLAGDNGGPEGFLRDVMNARPVEPPRKTCSYQCTNFILLGLVAERAGGKPLDVLAKEKVFDPIGMRTARWWPVADDGHVVRTRLKGWFEPGTNDLVGVVHDELARFAGRPVGNAGVFATLEDMRLFVEDLLNRRALPQKAYDLLFTCGYEDEKSGERRSFGFDMGETARRIGLSKSAVFHTGFTGQLIVVDPASRFAGVALTLRQTGGPTGLAARRALLAAARNAGPELVLGVLGDMHVTAGDKGIFSSEKLKRALAYFKARNVDGVLCTGDIAHGGSEADFKAFADVWFAEFPDNRAPDGHVVERLFVYGNHDVVHMGKVDTPEGQAKRTAMWEKIWHEPYQRFVHKTVKGFDFFGIHWEDSGYCDCDAMLEELKRAVAKTDPAKPFFYAQHRHLAGTCYSALRGDCDGGLSAKILSAYPNAVAFSGHSHYPLTDEAGFWHGAFTSVGTGAAAFDLFTRPGRENDDQPDPTRSMPRLVTGKDAQHPLMNQGMVLSVYPDRMVFERREFTFGESLGADWIVPRPFVAEDGLAEFNRRREAAAKDRLWFKSGNYEALRYAGKNRGGEPEEQLAVLFPPAVAKGGNRAFDYEVTVAVYCGDWMRPLAVKRIHPADFYLPAGHERPWNACLFSAASVGLGAAKRRYIFKIEALDAYGNRHSVIGNGRWVGPEDVLKPDDPRIQTMM